MRRSARLRLRALFLAAPLYTGGPAVAAATDCVVLLHGLARSADSMRPLEAPLREAGYDVVNVGYPSRSATIDELAPKAVEAGIAGCQSTTAPVHFVTHSLGGILIRYYAEQHGLERLDKVVMLAPPNQGSQVVDNLRRVPGFALLNGPAGLQLGTDAASVPLSLGPVRFTLGVIAGTKTFNPFLSLQLPNPDDGKVSVANTRVEGMTDFVTVPHSHPFIMRAPAVISQVLTFLRTGTFAHDAP